MKGYERRRGWGEIRGNREREGRREVERLGKRDEGRQ